MISIGISHLIHSLQMIRDGRFIFIVLPILNGDKITNDIILKVPEMRSNVISKGSDLDCNLLVFLAPTCTALHSDSQRHNNSGAPPEVMDGIRILNYSIAVAPLVISQLIIPPLSYFLGERADIPFIDEIYRHLTPPNLLNFKYLHSLMFDPQDLKGNKIYTLLSYMFIHADYNHLLCNLQTLVTVSYPVYQEFGPLGLYSIFLGSGIVAVSPSFLREKQQNGGNKPLYQKLWKGFMNSVIPPRCCGSSGANFGLFAGSNLIHGFRLVRNIHAIKVKWRRESRTNRNGSPQSWTLTLLKLLRETDFVSALYSLLQISTAVTTVKLQIDLANRGGEGNIDNAAHVQGFIGGIAITTLFQFIKLHASRSYSTSK
jgi:membrane associated rhomboid family serine protease